MQHNGWAIQAVFGAAALCMSGGILLADCWIDDPDGTACDYWVDLDDCPDTYLGGSKCGVVSAPNGSNRTFIDATCQKITYVEYLDGSCDAGTNEVVHVTCPVEGMFQCGTEVVGD